MPRLIGRNCALLALLLWFGLLEPTPARGQFHSASDPVATPPEVVIGQDDAAAIDVNPAALGLLPSWSLVYLHSQVDQPESWLSTGDAFFAASPLLLGLAAGLSVQSIRPGDASYDRARGRVGRGMATIGLSFAPSDELSFGGLVRLISSSSSEMDDLGTSELGALWRPVRWLGMSLVGRDLLATRSGHGTESLGLGPSAVLSTFLRPFGTRALSLELAAALDHDGRVGSRGGLILGVPWVGSISAMAEVEHLGDQDAVLRVMSGLSVHWGKATFAGGAFSPADFRGETGWYGLLRMEGAARAGIPPAGYVLDLELSNLSPRRMVGFTMVLEMALRHSQVAGVLLRLRRTEMGLAYAQELRSLIRRLRAAGKPVACHLDSASGAEYYACAGADQVLMDPAGVLRLMGSASRVVLLGDALRNVGLRAQFVRIGSYKSAPEQLNQGQMSEQAREQTKGLVDGVYTRMLADLSQDLGISRARVEQALSDGPHLAVHAVGHGLVSDTADAFRLKQAVRDTFEDRSLERGLPKDAPEQWGVASSIGVVLVDGSIVDGNSIDIPILDIHFSGGQTISKALETMADDPAIGAIVLRVDSPGGAVMASDQIWRAVRRARRRKPVLASMGALGASGGYYVACAADEIWADPSTITGSIGIFYGKVDVEGLAERLGIGVEFFKRGGAAGAETIWRPYSPSERAALVGRLRTYYRLFLHRIATARGRTAEQLDALGRGRVFSGQEALRNGLVDHLGGLSAALDRARKLAGLPPDTGITVLPRRKLEFLDYMLAQAVWGGEGQPDAGLETPKPSETGFLRVPEDLRSVVALVAALHQAGGAEPLALMPYVLEF